MKKIFIFLLLMSGIQAGRAQVAINTNGSSPASSAMLDVSSSNKGVLISRMTSAQRRAISNPEPGLLVYDLDKQTPYLYDGAVWRPLVFSLEENVPLIERGAPNIHHNGQLGSDVAIWNNTAVAGAPLDSSNGLGSAGAAYVYSKESGTWRYQARLIPPVSTSGGAFGTSVDIEGDMIVVGAPIHNVAGKPKAGTAYVYKRSGNAWNLVQQLTGSQETTNAYFGISVSIHNGRIAVGASGQPVGAHASSGAVYIFKYNGTSFVEEKFLNPSLTAASSSFGYSVSLHSGSLLIGAPRATQNGLKCGLALMYTLAANTQQWTYVTTIQPPTMQADMYFGNSVDIRDDKAIIGAPYYDIPFSDNDDQGLIMRLKKSGAGWVEEGWMTGKSKSIMGFDVALDATGFMVSGPGIGLVYFYLYDSFKSFIYKDALPIPDDTSVAFGRALAIHNGTFIIGDPVKGPSTGSVQFGTLDQ